jgi:hypothetical protein
MREFDDIFSADEIEKVLHDNYRDRDIKEIGDRVGVIDFSSVTRLDGSQIDEYDEDMQFNILTYFIVVNTRQRHSYNAGWMNYNQDLIIVNPKNKMYYRAFSGHVTIIKK